MEAQERPFILETGIGKAVQAAGGTVPLSRKLGVTRQAVHAWLVKGYAPMLRAVQIEELYQIPRAECMNPILMRGSLSDALSPDAQKAYVPRKWE